MHEHTQRPTAPAQGGARQDAHTRVEPRPAATDPNEQPRRYAAIENQLGTFIDDSPSLIERQTPIREELRHDTSEHDAPRPDVHDRVEGRMDATGHVQTRPITNNREFSRQNAGEHEAPDFREWIEIDETQKYLQERGITRTIRTLQKYCQNNRLTCELVPTENGVRYLVDTSSIDIFVEKHNMTMPSSKDIAAYEGASRASANDAQIPASNDSMLQMKDETIKLIKTQLEQVSEQLRIKDDQLRAKDEQIEAMLERDRETNILIQNLQKFVPLPERTDRNSPIDTEHREAA